MRIPSRTGALVLDLLRTLKEEAQARQDQDAAEAAVEAKDGDATPEPQPECPPMTTGEAGGGEGGRKGHTSPNLDNLTPESGSIPATSSQVSTAYPSRVSTAGGESGDDIWRGVW